MRAGRGRDNLMGGDRQQSGRACQGIDISAAQLRPRSLTELDAGANVQDHGAGGYTLLNQTHFLRLRQAPEQEQGTVVDQSHKKWLLLLGALLFLIGLLTGVLVQSFPNPRMGLSAHLAGVQNALFLLVIGAVWQHVRLSGSLRSATCWTTAYGMYAFWLSLLLAAIWGTSRATPLAGEGFASLPWKETTVQLLLYSASLSSIVAAALLVLGFARSLRDPAL